MCPPLAPPPPHAERVAFLTVLGSGFRGVWGILWLTLKSIREVTASNEPLRTCSP